jgi:hypothetical protein
MIRYMFKPSVVQRLSIIVAKIYLLINANNKRAQAYLKEVRGFYHAIEVDDEKPALPYWD